MPEPTAITGVLCTLKVRLDRNWGCLDTAWTVLGQCLDSAWTMFLVLGECLDECFWVSQTSAVEVNAKKMWVKV